MPKDQPEQALDIDVLLAKITSAVAKASADLNAAFETGEAQALPYILRLPRVTCSIRLSLSYTGQKVRGIFRRVKTSEEQEIVSTIELEIAAVPRPERPPRA